MACVKRGASRGVLEDERNLEGGDHEEQLSGLEGATAEERGRSKGADTHTHTHEGVGGWTVGAAEGRQGTGLGLCSLPPSFTLVLALAALRPHTLRSTPSCRLKVHLVHTSNSRPP